jgi:hypothetical protein
MCEGFEASRLRIPTYPEFVEEAGWQSHQCLSRQRCPMMDCQQQRQGLAGELGCSRNLPHANGSLQEPFCPTNPGLAKEAGLDLDFCDVALMWRRSISIIDTHYKIIYKKRRCSADATPPSHPRDTTVASARQLVWVVMRPSGYAPPASRRVPTSPFLFRPCSGPAIAPPRHPCGYPDHRLRHDLPST